MTLPYAIFDAEAMNVSPGAYKASKPFVVAEADDGSKYIVLDVLAAFGGGAGKLEWYLEFTSGDPGGSTWYPETAQEDAGSGNVAMPLAVRTLEANGGGNVTGNARFSVQLRREHVYAHVQARAVTAACALTIFSVVGGGVE